MKDELDNDFTVQFVPMRLVLDALIENIHLTETRTFKEVQKKSYTFFQEEDVLFAKVTPCMENGKIAIAKNLKNKIGYGSSEFHVFRCSKNLTNQYLFFFLIQSKLRNDSQQAMTGAVGLRRVPKKFLEEYRIPLAPLPEQRAIVAKIEQLFSELDNGVANLKAAKDKLEIFRQAVLQKAFEGELTASTGIKWITLGEVCDKVEYGSSSKSKTKGLVPVLRMGNIQKGRLDWSDLKYSDDPEEIEKYSLREGDVLFNRTNSAEHVGKTALYQNERKAIFAGYLIRIHYQKDKVNGNYLTHFLNSHTAKRAATWQ
ncbi:hypothetical protein GMJAKD_00850 [Candidatus Electrothrix aarhusensis]